ncbi:hypothetical protein K461DRAFT_325065 [Myriangium duriaei CBS 260.36]|uniref:Rhodopsin domain-containing protein n=1 Tax=Myriangium duriaei CBS 260.36 TaxID=1168546 RepID=A0A9P4IQC8_9PEZI|nr:hypothetical protein K461DRAFT_325065 [Myriangium duriaei CBS 260.36]
MFDMERRKAIEGNVYGGSGPALMASSFTQLTVACIVVGLRIYGAKKRAGQIRWDFIWVGLATIIGLVTQVFFVLAVINGIGRHLKDITFPELFAALKWSWLGIIVGITATAFAKLAIVALFLQVATPQQPKRKAFLWFIASYSTAVTFVQMIVTLTQCVPVQRLWYVAGPGSCPRQDFAAKFGYFQGASAALTDTILALYPISIVWGLQASLRTKVGFCMLMGTGLLCTIASTIRTVYVKKLTQGGDVTTELATFLAWANTELWFIIILGSVPPLRPLFISWFGTVRSKVTETSMTRDTRAGGTTRMLSVDNRMQTVDARHSKADHSLPVMTDSDGERSNSSQKPGEQIVVNYTIETTHEDV